MCYSAKIFRSHVKSISSVASSKGRPFKYVPGPLRVPFAGFLNETVQLGNPKTLHITVSKHHKKYGPLFRIKIAKADAIFIKDPDMMREVFVYEGKYPKHPLPEAWTYFNQKHSCKRGLFFMDDEEWFQYRKLLNQPLMRDVSWMKDPIEKTCDKTIESLLSKHGQGFEDNRLIEIDNIESTLYRWSIEVILSLMLGSSYNASNLIKLNDLVEQFSHTVYKIFQYSSKLMAIPPHLADNLQLDAWQNFERIVPESLELANKIIDVSLDDIERGDGLLSKLQSSIPSREDVKRIFADFIIAAGDTTSFATMWCLYLLGKNQAAQELVRNGIKDDDLESPLIRGTVREALRMFPVAPFIGRFLDKDAIIGGYCIPKNTLALLSLYSAGRDKATFHSPNEFMPQRWIRGDDINQNYPKQANASLPFAMGSRSCVGRKIALYQMHFLLTKILKKYHLTVQNKEDIEAELKLVTVPNAEIRLTFQKREI